ncbi:MAG: peptidoglycan-binding protein, partial [Candidatus Omnitrophica bacterium]|nr:peptidoglycan-binding protein [Candidatus Omnitrophota bacterium]
VERMTAEQAQALEEIRSSKEPVMSRSNISIKTRDERSSQKMKDIQIARKNAGFYTGSIDGIKGKATRKAIRDFQKAHGLKADGVVGSKTWEALNQYLYSARASSGRDEGADIK